MTNWFTSKFQNVREKSLEVLKFVRNDLSEFTTVIKTDTENYLNKIQNHSDDDRGIKRIGSKLNDVDTLDYNHAKSIVASPTFDRLHHERIRLQNDESTYLIDPIPTETYENWRKVNDFNVDQHKDEIAQILIDAPHIRLIYARLVPACTSHSQFWSRYYFRLHQLNEEETKRINLLKRAHEICNENNGDDWDEPNDEWSKETSNINQQLPITTSEIKESNTGDSWEQTFDETDLVTCKTNVIPLESSQNINQSENLSLPITMKKTDNEFDDEWESWS